MVAIGIGEGHHTALQKTMAALATPFEEQRERFIEQWQRAANPEWLAAKARRRRQADARQPQRAAGA